jgi:hypothetical protein
MAEKSLRELVNRVIVLQTPANNDFGVEYRIAHIWGDEVTLLDLDDLIRYFSASEVYTDRAEAWVAAGEMHDRIAMVHGKVSGGVVGAYSDKIMPNHNILGELFNEREKKIHDGKN